MGLGWCFVGVDLGQARDPTAVAVVECAEVLGAWDAVMYARRKHIELRLRHLERMALGTPYPAAAERVVKITRSAEMAGRCTLVVDATGVGRPVVDLLKRERPGCTPMPVNITGGASETRNGDYYGVPKRDLVTGLQVLLQSGGLQIAAGIPYGAALVAEMADMRAKVTAAYLPIPETHGENPNRPVAFPLALLAIPATGLIAAHHAAQQGTRQDGGRVGHC